MNKLLYVSLLILLAGIAFGQPKPINLNWECNMEIEILSGRFVTTDTVAARGTFNGWGRDNLVPLTANPDIYVSSAPYVDTLDVGDTVKYKFFYTPDTWESGSDRVFVLSQAEYDAGEALIARGFNDGTLETVTNQATEVLFKVDVSNAVVNGGSCTNGMPFPAVHTVHIAGGTSPLQWPALGWPDVDITKMIELNDQGMDGDETAGDMIFSTTITFPAYTLFHVEYKYGINYGLGPDSTGCVDNFNDNENGVGANHTIELFASAWYCEVLDTFGIMGPQDFTTDVEPVSDLTPSDFSLEQNYPNPFNPSTTINFSIPNEAFVTLDVYNAIGQKVALLVNETKSAGTYSADFNASNLTSGIYFYKISAGNFTETKKMILMK